MMNASWQSEEGRFCLQETFAAHSTCFGCGPANAQGLRVRSMALREDYRAEVVACWKPELYHEAFPGVLNGGIVGALLDCHSNWTAAWYLAGKHGLERPPCTVTAEYAVQLKRPTPSQELVFLSARVVECKEDRAVVEATLSAGEKICATCRGTFVAVKPGHPAYHRW